MEMLNKIFKTSDVPMMDRYTIEHEDITSWALMERAAHAWVTFFNKMSKKTDDIVVVAGQGNNGGDGYAIARMLKEQGRHVKVVALHADRQKSADCAQNAMMWSKMGGEVELLDSPDDLCVCDGCVLIDALFGSGLNRPLTGKYAGLVRRINEFPNMKYAVDIPSGLMGEDNGGNDRSAIVKADVTLTFQFPKLAFLLPENSAYVGEWHVLDIALDTDMVDTGWYCTTLEDVARLLPLPGKFDHKGVNGKGLLVAGSRGMMGAAVLAARAALHSGIGLLYCHIPAACCDIMQIAVPEAVLDLDVSDVHFEKAENVDRYDALAVGPGLGQHEDTARGLGQLLEQWKGNVILDADAINILALRPDLLERLHRRCILTPHFKEFERLVGKSENDFERLNKLSNFAKCNEVYVILKGAFSVLATPAGEFYFNMSGNPGMAKGGSGDVLTGILLALAAGGLGLEHVARIGAFVHGLSADLLSEKYGLRGITSGMIAEGLGEAWKKIENKKK